MPVPFTARALCEEVAARRGRSIRLVPMARSADVCGLWVATDEADVIFYEPGTTPPHQEHIILHELSHLLCDHYPGKLSVIAQAQLLLPGLDKAMVERILGRTGYSTVEEREAEMLASLIRQRQYHVDPGRTVADRLRNALQDGAPDRGHVG
jgi:hypothetical protein